MAVTNIRDLKAHLSAWLEKVAAGDEVVITDRGRPVAKIVPLLSRESIDQRTEALIRTGVLRPRQQALPDWFWTTPAPRVPGDAAVDAILAERAEGR
ncbi:MAG TPA: type II toxin-antitoxin system prevent-host-death family antitoxin [Bacillota bacterium]|nr:type II toxin-antitoxin system prevent-host-death family antitoxin [Bacillota bacterium]